MTKTAMEHLGVVLYYFSNLRDDDRCRGFDEALEFYNFHNPSMKIEKEEATFEVRLQRKHLITGEWID